MQRNKTRLPAKAPKVLLENPQDSHGSSICNSSALMPLTPTLENEALSKAMSWQEDSFIEIMLADPCGNNSSGIEHHGSNNSTSVDEGLDAGMLWLDGLMREEVVDPIGDVILGEKEERENEVGAIFSEEREGGSSNVSIREDLGSVNLCSEQYCSSTNSLTGEGNWLMGYDWDWDWDWETLVEGHDLIMGEHEEEEEEEKRVGWLWDYNGEGKVTGGDKKAATVAPLLS